MYKEDPYPDGVLNTKANSVQPRDTGEFFRIVDCKYIYNLDVSTLGVLSTRQGTYFVYLEIDGTLVVVDPAVFDLM